MLDVGHAWPSLDVRLVGFYAVGASPVLLYVFFLRSGLLVNPVRSSPVALCVVTGAGFENYATANPGTKRRTCVAETSNAGGRQGCIVWDFAGFGPLSLLSQPIGCS